MGSSIPVMSLGPATVQPLVTLPPRVAAPDAGGGGLYNDGGQLDIENSLVVENTAGNGGGVLDVGQKSLRCDDNPACSKVAHAPMLGPTPTREFACLPSRSRPISPPP